jgi:CO/xanthine dehydrogenase Mo-binding subunit
MGQNARQPAGAVGAPVRRVDADDKVTGRARYLDDIVVPGMAHAALVLPGAAHASVRGVNDSRARSIPGFIATLTASDVPGENQVGCVDRDQPLLAGERVRYSGDAVAITVAESPTAARDAARAVALELDELEGVFDAEQAMRPDAPRVHEDGNAYLHYRVHRGNVERGFDEADVIVERTFRTNYQEHSYLEPLGALAVPEDGGTITVYGTMQCPYYVQKAVAGVLGIPLARVRIIQTVTGGGFGGKEDVPSEICACAAVAAWRTGRPVKLVHTREEDFYRSSKRHPMVVRYKLGATRDGRFTAADIHIIADAGAYSTLTPVVLFRSVAHATGPYEIPNVRTDGHGVYTNRQTTGAFRGFGQPQTIFANESVIDEIAETLGIDPIEIRLANCLAVGKRTATGQLLEESVGLPETLVVARDESGWTGKRAAKTDGRAAPDGDRVLRGIGVGSIYYGVSLGAKGLALDASGAHVNLYRDGSLRVAVGGTEMGQGLLTVLSQMASDVLGIPVASVHVDHVDTSVVPDSGPSVASRTTLMTGNALIDAATKLKRTLAGVAAERLGGEPDAVHFENGQVLGNGKSLDFKELAELCWVNNVNTAEEGWYAAPESTFDEDGQGNAYAVYSFATQVAEVEVDTRTGEVRVLRVTAAHDVGRVLNPVTLEGQLQGGVLQGVGMALYESMKTDGGVILTPDFSTYILPTSLDTPEISCHAIEAPYSKGPFGAKGIGETPAMPGAVAIANAVAHATGIRFTELPITAEAVRLRLAQEETT